MPLYEYLCPSCATRFEWLQRVGESGATVVCPECGGRGVERQLSTFAAAVGGGPAAGAADAAGCGRPQCGGGFCAGAAGDWD